MNNIKILAKNEKVLGSLIKTIRIFSRGIGKEFGNEKCARIIMKKEKQLKKQNCPIVKTSEHFEKKIPGNIRSGYHLTEMKKTVRK